MLAALAVGPYESQALLEDPYVLVVAEDSPMAGISGSVDLSDYPELPLMSYGKMRAVHSIEARLGRPAYGRRVVFRSNQTSTLLSLARLGQGQSPDRRVAWPDNRPLSGPASGFVRALEQVADGPPFS